MELQGASTGGAHGEMLGSAPPARVVGVIRPMRLAQRFEFLRPSSGEILVFSPTATCAKLSQKGPTVLDFAFRLHSNSGHAQLFGAARSTAPRRADKETLHNGDIVVSRSTRRRREPGAHGRLALCGQDPPRLRSKIKAFIREEQAKSARLLGTRVSGNASSKTGICLRSTRAVGFFCDQILQVKSGPKTLRADRHRKRSRSVDGQGDSHTAGSRGEADEGARRSGQPAARQAKLQTLAQRGPRAQSIPTRSCRRQTSTRSSTSLAMCCNPIPRATIFTAS